VCRKMATALYKEDDSPLLKEWIITRLENTLVLLSTIDAGGAMLVC